MKYCRNRYFKTSINIQNLTNIKTYLKITITHNNGSIILQLRHKMCNIIDNDLVFLFYTILPLFLFKITQHPNKDYKNTKNNLSQD